MENERPTERPLPPLGVSRPSPVSPVRTAVATMAALVLPGLGHLALGRWVRGLMIGLGIALMFALGLWMKGHLYKPEPGEWITWLFSFADLGIGLPYFILFAADLGFQLGPNQAAAPTYEYGNTFLLVAGLLNMLATLDVYDIAVGRKA